jgi:parallel beta-helix repeat protein
VSVKDFGAVGDGVTDDTTTIRNAVAQSAGKKLFFPKGIYLVSAHVEVPAYTSIVGEGVQTIFKMSNPNSSLFEVLTQSYVTFEDFSIECALTGTTPYVAGIALYQTVYSLVQNVRMFGLSHFGVLMQNSGNNTVRGCEFFNWRGTIQDSTDIICRDNSNFNIVEGNHCYGGGDVGISVFDSYAGATPTGNVIANNVVGAHKAYGIMAYVTSLYDTQTVIDGNNIRDIDGLGSTGSGAFGSGIYIQSAAGTVCSNNKISNCCINTTNFGSLAPAGIGITNILSTTPVVCVGNSIVGMTKAPGIMCNTSTNVIISDNSINIANSGAGTNGHGILVVNVPRINISGNNIKQGTAGYWGINIVSDQVGGVDATIVEGNNVLSSGYGIGFNNVAGGTFLRSTVSNNVVESADLTCFMGLSTDANIVANHFLNGVNGALSMSGVTRTRVVNNTMVTNGGTYAVGLSGTGSRNLLDETNYYNAGSSGTVLNDSTSGFIVSQYGTAAPASSGTWGVGDRVIQSVPVVGNPKGWRCTVAGNPGTWVSEGNL